MGQYHDTLGVSSSASDADIKKAYKKLSSKHHPDKTHTHGWSDDETAKNEAEYKKISEAYRNLKKGVHDPVQNTAGWNHQPRGGFNGMDGINEMMNQMLIMQHIIQTARSPIMEAKMQADGSCVQMLGVPLSTLLTGGDITVDTVYPVSEGGRLSLKRHIEKITVTKNTPLGTHYKCTKAPIVLVFSPIHDGSIPLSIDGLDITTEFKVSVVDALLERSVTYEHIDGSKIKITIPKMLSAGKLIRIPNRGLTHISGQSGHLYLSVSLYTPELDTIQIGKLTKVFDKLKL